VHAYVQVHKEFVSDLTSTGDNRTLHKLASADGASRNSCTSNIFDSDS